MPMIRRVRAHMCTPLCRWECEARLVPTAHTLSVPDTRVQHVERYALSPQRKQGTQLGVCLSVRVDVCVCVCVCVCVHVCVYVCVCLYVSRHTYQAQWAVQGLPLSCDRLCLYVCVCVCVCVHTPVAGPLGFKGEAGGKSSILGMCHAGGTGL